MSADKRSLTGFDNPNNFPGKINPDTNRYEFPILYKLNNNGKPRQWVMYCRLIKEDSMDQEETKGQNWNMLAENEVKMKQEYLPDGAKIPDGTIAQLWSETGVMGMKISRSAATYITEPKNRGKKNERNVLQQALVNIRSKFLKKMDEGSTLEITDSDTKVEVLGTTKFFPMLAKKYEAFVNKIKYPMYGQPKLDGNRCVIFLDTIKNPTYKNVIMYTRQKKEYPYTTVNDNIRQSLLQLLIDNYDEEIGESLFLDGELYLHDKSLQGINSTIRGQSTEEDNIQYWIYDHFYPSYGDGSPDIGFSKRAKNLENIYSELDKKYKKDIILVPTKLIKSQNDCDKLYKEFLADHYEGMMLRTPDGSYLKSATKKSEQLRSKDLLKRKETYDDEFEVVDYKDGEKGKEVGAIIWICDSKNGKGDTFSVTPNMPLKERYEIYKECQKKFDKKYKGRLLTVEYRGLSDNNIPLQLKAVGFRDVM